MINRCGWCLEYNDELAVQCSLCGHALLLPEQKIRDSWPVMTLTGWSQGTDISDWDDSPEIPGGINFAKMHGAGARFCIHRRNHGPWADTIYPVDWPKIHTPGEMYRAAYDYLTWDRTGVQQAQAFLELLGGDYGDIPPIADYECRVNVPASKGYMRQQLVDWLFTVYQAILRDGWKFRLESVFGNRPLIYTSPYYWLEYGSSDQYWKQYGLWIANYYVEQPYIPAPWTDWVLWQYTDRGDGHAYGVEALEIDLNWYNGTLPDFVPDPTPPPTPPPGGFMVTYKVIKAVNQRVDHTLSGNVIQTLPVGAVLACDDVWVGSKQAWAHAKAPDGRLGWVAICYSGTWYLSST